MSQRAMRRQLERAKAARAATFDRAADVYRLEVRKHLIPAIDRLGEALYQTAGAGQAATIAAASSEWERLDKFVWGLRTVTEQRALRILRKRRGQPLPESEAMSKAAEPERAAHEQGDCD